MGDDETMNDFGTPKLKVVIFSKSHTERDVLRYLISVQDINPIFFEHESICFDNLNSIQPDVVVLRTDSKEVVCRFMIVTRILKLAVKLIIVSGIWGIEDFTPYRAMFNPGSIVVARLSEKLNDAIQQPVRSDEKMCDHNDRPLLIGESTAITNIMSLVPVLRKAHDPILIYGEQGTGKELAARIFAGACNSNGPIMKFDCKGLCEGDISSGFLFGTTGLTKLTDATSSHGDRAIPTVLLDSIDQANTMVQSEILMLLEKEKKLSAPKKTINSPMARFIATSTNDLKILTKKGKFRRDLFYRLNVIPIEIPPLRKRKEDICLLADFLLLQSRKDLHKSFMVPSVELKRKLYLHDWPGNVDELRTVIQRVSIAGNESIIQSDGFFPQQMQISAENMMKACERDALPELHEIKTELKNLREISLKSICDKFISHTEKSLMQRALEFTNWNRKKAAKLLNISYRSMLNKIKIYKVT